MTDYAVVKLMKIAPRGLKTRAALFQNQIFSMVNLNLLPFKNLNINFSWFSSDEPEKKSCKIISSSAATSAALMSFYFNDSNKSAEQSLSTDLLFFLFSNSLSLFI